MEAKELRIEQSFEWVLSCIKSCVNKFQLDSCRVLVQLFKIKYEGERELFGLLESAIIDAEIFMSVDA